MSQKDRRLTKKPRGDAKYISQLLSKSEEWHHKTPPRKKEIKTAGPFIPVINDPLTFLFFFSMLFAQARSQPIPPQPASNLRPVAQPSGQISEAQNATLITSQEIAAHPNYPAPPLRTSQFPPIVSAPAFYPAPAASRKVSNTPGKSGKNDGSIAITRDFVRGTIQFSNSVQASVPEKTKMAGAVIDCVMKARERSKLDQQDVDKVLGSGIIFELTSRKDPKLTGINGIYFSDDSVKYKAKAHTIYLKAPLTSINSKTDYILTVIELHNLVETILHECHHAKIALQNLGRRPIKDARSRYMARYSFDIAFPFRTQEEFATLKTTIEIGLNRVQKRIPELLAKKKAGNLNRFPQKAGGESEVAELARYEAAAKAYAPRVLRFSMPHTDPGIRNIVKQINAGIQPTINIPIKFKDQPSSVISRPFCALTYEQTESLNKDGEAIPGYILYGFSACASEISLLETMYYDWIEESFDSVREKYASLDNSSGIYTAVEELHAIIRSMGSNITSVFFSENEAFERQREAALTVGEQEEESELPALKI